MDNKLMSLIIKVGMGILVLIGVILIAKNLGFDSTGSEPIANQEFYNETFTVPGENGKKDVEKSIIHYNYVIDNDFKVIVDLEEGEFYNLKEFTDSRGEVKTILDIENNTEVVKYILAKISEDENREGLEDVAYVNDFVDPVLMNEHDLQNATGNSIVYTQWLMYGGLILILGFTIFNIIQNPKRFIRLAIGLVLLVIITAACYYSVESVGTGKVTQLSSYSDASYHVSSTGIAMFIVLTAIAGAMILVGIVTGALRYFQK